MANQEHLQKDEYDRLREEFHQLIVPLMHRSLHDKPTDVAMYCARYFQALLEDRQRISGNVSVNLQEGGGEKAKSGAGPQVQESTSLPILTDVRRDRWSLRETSSWSSPSDATSTPRCLWNVADALSRIGDQPAKEISKEGAMGADNCSAKSSVNQLFVGDEGSKDKEKDLQHLKRKDDSSIFKPNVSSATDEGIASPVDSEVEEELISIVNSASSSTDATSQTYRKKWSSHIDSYLDLTLKSELAEAVYEEEGEFDANSNLKQCSPEEEDAESPSDPCGSTSHNVSRGSVPQLKELASAARGGQCSNPCVQREIEDSVKLISESLQELVKVLDSMKLFCSEKLRRVETLSEALPEKPQRAPRKKRSVTTFSSSDNLLQSKEFSRGPGNKPTTTAANKGCSKTPPKLVELKYNGSEVESGSFGSGNPLKGKKSEEQPHEIAQIEEINVGASDVLSCKKESFLDRSLVKNGRNINETKIDSKDTCMNGKFCCREGFVNKGFVIDDSGLHRQNPRLGHRGHNWWLHNGYRRSMFDEQSPFSQIRIPRPSSGRNINLTRHHSHTPRQMPASRFSHIGEGGDVFSTIRRQCSVATETQATQTNERIGTFDARIRTIRIHPVANGNAEQEAKPSEQVNVESACQVSERELQSSASSPSVEQSSKLSGENPGQSGFAEEDEKVEEPENRTEVKPSKKSSSLNPCAECFNPPSKIVQNLEFSKSPEENDASHSEKESSGFADATEELPTKNLPKDDAEWDYEMFLEDFLLEDEEPILYRNLDSDGYEVPLTKEEDEDHLMFENKICGRERDPQCFSSEENRLTFTSPAEEKQNCKKPNCPSDEKLAEGDQGSEASEERAEGSESAEKREEPGLSSACGDFVAFENNNESGESSGDEAENAPVAAPSDAIAFDMDIPGFLPVNADDSGSQSRRLEEEMELNFACFSGSDSSEEDSSDISEEEDEFAGDNDENKLEEKV